MKKNKGKYYYFSKNLPIKFVYLKKMGGWYYTKNNKKKKGPLIELDVNLGFFEKFELAIHEFIHFLCDIAEDFPICDKKEEKELSKIKSLKPVEMPKSLPSKVEENLAKDISVFARKKIQQVYIKNIK